LNATLDPGAPPARRTAAMRFIMGTMLIDMVSIGIIIPVMLVLVGQFTASLADQAFWDSGSSSARRSAACSAISTCGCRSWRPGAARSWR
jgi:hypothetical protein